METNTSGIPYNPAAVAITGGSANFDAGTASLPSITLSGDTTTGWYRSAADNWTWTASTSPIFRLSSGGYTMGSAAAVSWGSGNATTAADTLISRQAAGRVVIMGSTAIPAGGSASLGLCFGSTSAFGIYIGSGVPTLSAAQGSLYLCSNGSSTSTRAYINTNGTTGWTAITTAA